MDQPKLFKDETTYKKVVKDGEYIYIPDFLSYDEGSQYFDKLLNTIYWKQEAMNMYGKTLPFPRLTAWYGDPDKSYSFSGLTLHPNKWTTELMELKRRVEAEVKTPFNSVLLNRYRNGSDSMSWHQDDEKELDANPVIASVNLGATRTFQLRHLQTREKLSLELSHGSLLVMMGKLNHFWQHQITKTKKQVGERINLTFREIK